MLELLYPGNFLKLRNQISDPPPFQLHLEVERQGPDDRCLRGQQGCTHTLVWK